MKKIVYSKQIENEFVLHENLVLQAYLKEIQRYVPFFEKKGYSLRTGLMWQVHPADRTLFQRPSFQNGYQCYFYCTVQKKGEDVYIDSTDGEADYYPLSAVWMISSIFRSFFKKKGEIYTSTVDVANDLQNLLSCL